MKILKYCSHGDCVLVCGIYITHVFLLHVDVNFGKMSYSCGVSIHLKTTLSQNKAPTCINVSTCPVLHALVPEMASSAGFMAIAASSRISTDQF